MKLVGLMPARNEAWCIGLSARVALLWCDELVILNHASTDETVDIVAELQREHPSRVHLISVPVDTWTEMEHRQMLLDRARMAGATHIAIVDADEILTGDLLSMCEGRAWFMNGQMHTVAMGRGSSILQLPGYNLRSSLTRYHSNGTWGQRWFSVAFKDSERLYWFHKGRNVEQFHHREPFGQTLIPYRPIAQGRGGVMHLWGVTDRHLRAKHRAYRIQETLRWPEKSHEEIERMYSWWRTGMTSSEPQTWQFADVPESWWSPYSHLMKYLDLERIPWQEAWCDEMIARHGLQRLEGLSVQ